jgi:hypothetical protein
VEVSSRISLSRSLYSITLIGPAEGLDLAMLERRMGP